MIPDSAKEKIEAAYQIPMCIEAATFGYSIRQEELEEWKRQAIEVMPDFQKIGNLLNVPLGQTIHDKIIPGIETLKTETERLKALIEQAHFDGYSDGDYNGKGKYSLSESFVLFKSKNNLIK